MEIKRKTPLYDPFLDGLLGDGYSSGEAPFVSKRNGKKLGGYYIYHSEPGACEVCSALDRQVFSTEEKEVGENYPPIHPHCKCTVKNVQEQSESMGVYELDEGNVWADISTLSGIGLLENGEVVIGEDADEDTITLFNLIYEREQPGADVEKLNQKIYEFVVSLADQMEEDGEIFNRETYISNRVNRTLDYYRVYDVTERIDEIVDKWEEDYSKSAAFVSPLIKTELFAFLVKSNGPYDLKSSEEFKAHSMFIYNHEIVSRDALGNITYGYIGKVFGFPDEMLWVGAGAAQIWDNGFQWQFAGNLFDDPRDTERINQGIEWYDRTHTIGTEGGFGLPNPAPFPFP